MIHLHAALGVSPEIIEKLSSGNQLWSAAHADGSDNRINSDAILNASTYGADFGILAALGQGIRKLFRNRGKTREDLAAEKEAARINRTSGALEELLLEYCRAAREGNIDEETLDELIDNLEEMQGYARAGKLQVPGVSSLTKIRKSIAAFTAAIAEEKNASPVREADASGADEFSLIRKQLLRQKELLNPTRS